MELLRQIAFKIEDASKVIRSIDIEIPSYDKTQIAYHCELMAESDRFVGPHEMATRAGGLPCFLIQRLTSAGHDFVDAARSDTVWNKAVATAKEKGVGLTVELTVQYLKSLAKEVLGIH
jgi:hypothetical protein